MTRFVYVLPAGRFRWEVRVETKGDGRLMEIAESATRGPWRPTSITETRSDVRGLPENTSYDARGDAVATAADSEFGACLNADAEFIATFDPPTVMGLLREVLRSPSSLTYRLKRDALIAARAIAILIGGEVQPHDRRGRIQDPDSFGGDSPRRRG